MNITSVSTSEGSNVNANWAETHGCKLGPMGGQAGGLGFVASSGPRAGGTPQAVVELQHPLQTFAKDSRYTESPVGVVTLDPRFDAALIELATRLPFLP